MTTFPEQRQISSASQTNGEPEPPTLSPAIIGRIILYVRCLYLDGDRQDAASGDLFDPVLHADSPLPDSIRRLLHYDGSTAGPRVSEESDMLLGAQATGVIGLLNPKTTDPIYRIDPVQAGFMLRRYRRLFPTEVSWIMEQVDHLKSKRTPRGSSDQHSRPSSQTS